MYEIGSIVRVLDDVTEDRFTIATIKLIEPDEEIPGVHYMYLVANNPALNVNTDPRIGLYWTLYPVTSPYVTLVSPPVQ